MKKLFLFAMLFFSAILFVNCSEDKVENNVVADNAKVTSYLNKFYSKDFELGKSVNSKIEKPLTAASKTIEFEDILVTEVFVGDDEIARGYVITQKSTNEFLYFIDVDRVDYKLTSVKIDVNETKSFYNIDELEKYNATNQLDFIKIAEEINETVVDVNERRRFWGEGETDCQERYQSTSNGTNWCQTYCYTPYYVFWCDVNGGVYEQTSGLHACP